MMKNVYLYFASKLIMKKDADFHMSQNEALESFYSS